MDRIRALLSEIPPCRLLADVGCDHGLLAAAALREGRAARVLLTDISAPSLHKAERLLAREIAEGRARAVCCDGLTGAEETPDVCVIAGMGGREIAKVIADAPEKPQTLVLSPHKNAPELREFLSENGYRITRDYTIEDGKYYDLLVAERGRETLTPLRREFGKTNLEERPAAFLKRAREEREKIRAYLAREGLSAESARALGRRLRALTEILGNDQD